MLPKMAEVSVLYFGLLRELVSGKKRHERVRIDDSATVLELIQKIADSQGQKFKNYVFDDQGKVRAGLAFAVDGDSVESASLKKMKCSEIKEFVILPPISGGA
jgi:molybdopterin converting factor small subunit